MKDSAIVPTVPTSIHAFSGASRLAQHRHRINELKADLRRHSIIRHGALNSAQITI
jgi:hypothetical protein